MLPTFGAHWADVPIITPMPTPAYPFTLPLLLRASKSRNQPANFTVSEPRRGFGYVQSAGGPAPVFWEGEFRLSPSQSVAFMLWFTQIINRGLLEFTMPIRTEFGLIEHVCQFLPDGLADAVEGGGCYTYKVKIMARAQIIPQAYIDATDMILTLPNWQSWAGLLDQTVNDALPEA